MMRASLLNLILFIAVALLYPEYHPTVHLTQSVPKILRVDIPETSQQKRPPPPPRPQVPLAVEGDEVPEDVTIESTELDLDKIFIPNLASTTGTDLDEPLDYMEIDYKPHPSRIVTPEYPAEARKKRIEGKVTVKVLVDKIGNVEDVQFIHGPEMFRKAALDAAWQFRFRPRQTPGRTPQSLDDHANRIFIGLDSPPSIFSHTHSLSEHATRRSPSYAQELNRL